MGDEFNLSPSVRSYGWGTDRDRCLCASRPGVHIIFKPKGETDIFWHFLPLLRGERWDYCCGGYNGHFILSKIR